MIKSAHVRLIVALALGLSLSQIAQARRNKLSPAKVKQIRNSNKSFQACRKEALGGLKSGSMGKKKFAIALKNCNESYPGASLYVACKKSVLKKANAQKKPPGKELAACKRYMVAASFNEKEPVPFFVKDNQLYFAGIGLNKSMPAGSISPPNFDCSTIPNIIKDPKSAQYILFGNHPRTFAGLDRLKGKDLNKALKFKAPSTNGVDIASFGRLFGVPTNSTGVVFFPSANCAFDGRLGKIFSGLSSYYLMDGANSLVTPYFGIAYYRAAQTRVKTNDLIEQAKADLGTAFKTFTKNKNVTFIAATDVSETDAEQDPKNLCRKPRKHQIVAVVQGKKDNPTQPDYMIMANIKNLCDYGDRMAKRVIR